MDTRLVPHMVNLAGVAEAHAQDIISATCIRCGEDVDVKNPTPCPAVTSQQYVAAAEVLADLSIDATESEVEALRLGAGALKTMARQTGVTTLHQAIPLVKED